MPPPIYLLATKTTAALRFAAAHSVYPRPLSLQELTTVQIYLLTLVYSLLIGDMGTVYVLLDVADRLPLLKSTYLRVWLKDDYQFREDDIARVLKALRRLLLEDDQLVPVEVLAALGGLEEKYCQVAVESQMETPYSMHSVVTEVVQAQRIHRAVVQTRDVGVQALPEVVSVGIQADLGSGSAPTSPRRKDSGEILSTNLRYSAERRLLEAAEAGDVRGAAEALRAGAVADCRSLQGLTPLHVAVKWNHRRLVVLLLEAGAIVDSRHCASGATPLHTAASLGHRDCALLLLDSGASPSLKDWKGRTPSQIALNERHYEVAQLIRSRGGV